MEQETTWGLPVPLRDAQDVRLQMQAEGLLRTDLQVGKTDTHLILPLREPAPGAHPYEFAIRASPPSSYQELLPPEIAQLAPRAFDQLGALVLVKLSDEAKPHASAIGKALQQFVKGCTGVFEDRGVVGEFRTRDLHCIAGDGATQTEIRENDMRLQIDPARAYFSPRLATERARVAELIQPGESVLDLFAGVGAMSILAARAGAHVTANDLNPAATQLLAENASANGATITIHTKDAMELLHGQYDRVILNLPHGASAFMPAASKVCSGTLHEHAILEEVDLADHIARLQVAMPEWTPKTIRIIRAYSTTMRHYGLDWVKE